MKASVTLSEEYAAAARSTAQGPKSTSIEGQRQTFENVIDTQVMPSGALSIVCNPHRYILAPGAWFGLEAEVVSH